jgi:hypothetical protein
MDCAQHVKLTAFLWVCLRAATRLPLPAEIDCQNAKSRRSQRPRLWAPAVFLETSSVSQHYGSVSLSVQVGIDQSAVLSWEGNFLLCKRESGDCGSGQPSA